MKEYYFGEECEQAVQHVMKDGFERRKPLETHPLQYKFDDIKLVQFTTTKKSVFSSSPNTVSSNPSNKKPTTVVS